MRASRPTYVPYEPKTILNKSKRADHWFWSRYSAYPYVGCGHGCAFCYCRERKYSPYEDVDDFSRVIKVKANAPDLLRKALSRAPADVVFTADYQPAEAKVGLSRQLLEVCLELGFPVFVLERSPLVLRDLDVLRAIQERAGAVAAFSIVSTPDSPGHDAVRALERLAPPAAGRFRAMAKLAAAGIVTGTCFMPGLPGLCDDEATLANIVRWTADHGGQFVIAGGLTLSDQQRTYFLGELGRSCPGLLPLYERLYPSGQSYGATGDWSRSLGLRVEELCARYGIRNRVPRPIIPGEKRALNKRIVEELANRSYTLEIHGEPSHRVWAYRKAAWAVEDLREDIGLVYDTVGVRGLGSIPGLGSTLAVEVEHMLSIWRAGDGKAGGAASKGLAIS